MKNEFTTPSVGFIISGNFYILEIEQNICYCSFNGAEISNRLNNVFEKYFN